MKEFIDYLERRIEGCDSLGGMEREKAIYQSVLKDYRKQLTIHSVSKRFDFDKLLQDYRQEFVNGGGYVKSDTFESGTGPYEVFEWFKKKLS